jgi:hypothetical protein
MVSCETDASELVADRVCRVGENGGRAISSSRSCATIDKHWPNSCPVSVRSSLAPKQSCRAHETRPELTPALVLTKAPFK